MKVIGITGGVGAGKSTILRILEAETGCFVLEADRVAEQLMQPGQIAYEKIVTAFSDYDPEHRLVCEDFSLDRRYLAELVFKDAALLQMLNQIVHPEVKRYIIAEIEQKKQMEYAYFFLEAALLIEDGYELICDELWYIYVPEELRIERLMASRGYSREKCIGIMRNQKDDTFYRQHCQYTIQNSGELVFVKKQIKELLKQG